MDSETRLRTECDLRLLFVLHVPPNKKYTTVKKMPPNPIPKGLWCSRNGSMTNDQCSIDVCLPLGDFRRTSTARANQSSAGWPGYIGHGASSAEPFDRQVLLLSDETLRTVLSNIGKRHFRKQRSLACSEVGVGWNGTVMGWWDGMRCGMGWDGVGWDGMR